MKATLKQKGSKPWKFTLKIKCETVRDFILLLNKFNINLTSDLIDVESIGYRPDFKKIPSTDFDVWEQLDIQYECNKGKIDEKCDKYIRKNKGRLR